MSIEFRCVSCDQLLRTADETAGKKTKCPNCGEIMGIPEHSTPENAGLENTGVGSLFSDRELGGGNVSGEAKPAGDPSTHANPYQTPSTLEKPSKDPNVPAGEEWAHGPQRVDLGLALSRPWDLCKAELGTVVLFGLMFIGVSILANIITQVLAIPLNLAAQAAQSVPLIVFAAIVQNTISVVSQVFLNLMGINFGLAFVRQHPSPLSQVFERVGQKLLPLIGFQVILMLFMFLVGLFAFGPAIGFAVMEQGVLALISGLVLGIPGLVAIVYISLRLFLTPFLIVDQDLKITDAMRRSSELMVGNKAVMLALVMVLGIIVGFGGILTCFIGFLFLLPFMNVVYAFTYLGIAGSKHAPM